MLKALIVSLKTWYVGALKTGGYWVVALMMAIESSVFPLPSEIVIPPAAYWAHTNQIPLSLPGLIIAGTVGSWLGATAMYWAARLAGRPLVMRYEGRCTRSSRVYCRADGGRGVFAAGDAVMRMRPATT